MLRVLLVTGRRKIIHSFIEGLCSDPEVSLCQVSSGAEAMNIVRTGSSHLVIVDSEPTGPGPLDLVREIISANAMVNTAVLSPLSDEDFHEKSEGLGILCRLPVEPGGNDAEALLKRLRAVLGM